MKYWQSLSIAVTLTVPLSGCVGVAVGSVRAADNEVTRNEYMKLALAGDAETQAQQAGIKEASELLKNLAEQDLSDIIETQNIPCTMHQVYGV